MVAFQTENFLASLHIPQFRGVVHGACCDQHAVGVKREAHDLHFVPFERVIALAGVGVPDFGLPVEATCHNFVAVGVIERHRVDNIGMFVEGEEFLAGNCVPYFAGAIVASCDKFATVLVKSAIGQREQMRPQHFKQAKSLLLILQLLLNQLLNQLLQLRFACL